MVFFGEDAAQAASVLGVSGLLESQQSPGRITYVVTYINIYSHIYIYT